MTDRPLRVALRTLGCKVNRAESEALVAELLDAGAEIVDPRDADVVVVNTCTVTGEADAKCRKEVRRALDADGEPVVVVTGCMAALDPDAISSLGNRVVVVSDKDTLAEAVFAAAAGSGGPPRVLQAGEAAPIATSDRGAEGPGRSLSERRIPPTRESAAPFRTRVMVKVQDGCDHRCAYCIVPDARGNPTSVPAAQVIERVAALAHDGTAEIVLTGVNLGRYRDGDTDLAILVERLAQTGIRRIRLSSIEPLDLTEGLLATLAATPAVMPHLHVPMQSGCDRTLAAMRRGYDTVAYAGALARARGALPGLAVTTDVIAGFPGESDADFEESLAFVAACGFTKLHVFRYSRRKGTPAADMPGQVPPPVKAGRAAKLRELGERLAAQYARSRVGGTADVLVERRDDRDATGTSEDYLRVRVRGTDAQVGNVVRVRIAGATLGGAEAVPC